MTLAFSISGPKFDGMETVRGTLVDLGPWIYALLMGYCALKSGYLPVFAGYFAGTGDLDLRWTVLSVFAGGYVGDEIRYWIGRRAGPKLLSYPSLARSMSLAGQLFTRNGAWYCFAYRYAKGLRTVGALPIGLTGWRWHRFAPINFASAATWASVLVGGGYVAGESVIDLTEQYGAWTSISIAVATLVGLAVLGRRMLRASAEKSA